MPGVRGTSNCKTGAGRSGTQSLQVRERPRVQKSPEQRRERSGRQRNLGPYAQMGKNAKQTLQNR